MTITDANGNEIVTRVPSVDSVRPLGSTVIIELLRPEEIMGTSLLIGEEVSAGGAPQAYVLDIGPAVDKERWGVKVGDRVVLVGTYTPLPDSAAKNGRKIGVVESHVIKAILIEKA